LCKVLIVRWRTNRTHTVSRLCVIFKQSIYLYWLWKYLTYSNSILTNLWWMQCSRYNILSDESALILSTHNCLLIFLSFLISQFLMNLEFWIVLKSTSDFLSLSTFAKSLLRLSLFLNSFPNCATSMGGGSGDSGILEYSRSHLTFVRFPLCFIYINIQFYNWT